MNRVQALRSHLPPSLVTFYRKPLLMERGEMQFLWDSEGKKYLDMFGGIVTVSVGHCHPETALRATLCNKCSHVVRKSANVGLGRGKRK
ncbi:hypothetical protein L596_010860 [Steinernema carpocapsae]|uniref:Alanine--glyoxylate aminotransferase 2, mitochondrial n=1 Tax=Steinernema carpocapsae TaxID=34508 RepID=A0A4U5PJW5_STECR|nr:hypothetical protein L596_010860 [Steinernema carpocapsae]